MSTDSAARPLPLRHPEDVEHLDGAARGELRIPVCHTCGQAYWPPGPVCPTDFGTDLGWVTDAGTGTVNAWVRFHKRYFPGDAVPYAVVQVTLDSGPRLTTTWAGRSEPAIGDPAAVSFREVGDGVVLPEFGPVAG